MSSMALMLWLPYSLRCCKFRDPAACLYSHAVSDVFSPSKAKQCKSSGFAVTSLVLIEVERLPDNMEYHTS